MLVFFFFLVTILSINKMVYITLVTGSFGFCGVREQTLHLRYRIFLKKFAETSLCKLVLLLLLPSFEGFL